MLSAAVLFKPWSIGIVLPHPNLFWPIHLFALNALRTLILSCYSILKIIDVCCPVDVEDNIIRKDCASSRLLLLMSCSKWLVTGSQVNVLPICIQFPLQLRNRWHLTRIQKWIVNSKKLVDHVFTYLLNLWDGVNAWTVYYLLFMIWDC